MSLCEPAKPPAPLCCGQESRGYPAAGEHTTQRDTRYLLIKRLTANQKPATTTLPWCRFPSGSGFKPPWVIFILHYCESLLPQCLCPRCNLVTLIILVNDRVFVLGKNPSLRRRRRPLFVSDSACFYQASSKTLWGPVPWSQNKEAGDQLRFLKSITLLRAAGRGNISN